MKEEVDPVRSKHETDVILVVKGAGEQAEDEHLNMFLRGFWPAVISLDSNATIDQVTDGMDDYTPSPHNEEKQIHKHLTEIRAKHRGVGKRVWVKESYWEPETLPTKGLGNLSKEWRMASFAFASLFQEIMFKRNTSQLKEWRLGQKTDEFRLGSAPGTRKIDYVGNYISYLILFSLVLLPFAATLSSGSWLDGTLLVFAVAAVWALAPAVEISRMHLLRYRKNILKSLPGLPGWLLIALILLLITDPVGYIRILISLLTLQVALLLSRRILWKYRKYANSDADRADYYSYRVESRVTGEESTKHMGKVDEWWLTRFPMMPLLYRYLVFLALPIGFVGVILVQVLKGTRILGGIGEALNKALQTMLVGYLDDVVAYAMDPAQSHRVRSAIKDDLIYFHKRPEVNRIHVIAHSQGTPITYETLFRFLEPEYQERVYTYVTIGSVLSYYHHARGVLDAIYHRRFPVEREKEQSFHPDFKWMNFWSFTDPITGFCGLDEYTWFKKAPPVDESYKRTRTSPTNIRSRSSAKNHGEYWSNIEQINTPFAKRVLGEPRPKEWAPDPVKSKDWHHMGVLLLWLSIVVCVGFLGFWLTTSGSLDFLTDYFTTVQASGQEVLDSFNALFVPKDGDEPNLLQKIVDLVTSEPMQNLWRQILNGSLVVLAAVAVLDWLGQLVRAVNIGREKRP